MTHLYQNSFIYYNLDAFQFSKQNKINDYLIFR